ncbi:MAG: hypothetical protein Q8S73_12305 [Deltaproteobacteria bacterium]|nr:hypothetical protein [Myxococcales bacterium]MDP3214881.1 hypothetical protein [Deltaproteobacteria bacterium]
MEGVAWMRLMINACGYQPLSLRATDRCVEQALSRIAARAERAPHLAQRHGRRLRGGGPSVRHRREGAGA